MFSLLTMASMRNECGTRCSLYASLHIVGSLVRSQVLDSFFAAIFIANPKLSLVETVADVTRLTSLHPTMESPWLAAEMVGS